MEPQCDDFLPEDILGSINKKREDRYAELNNLSQHKNQQSYER